MPNLILLLIGLTVLGFVALIWLRQSLFGELEALGHNQAILKKDLEKFRDVVPFLLEGARETQISDSWNLLVQKRGAFVKASTLVQEFEFERDVKTFMENTSCRNVMFLDAKKDLDELTLLTANQRVKMNEMVSHYNQKRKQFPYSLASGIFGIREVTPL